MNAMFDLELTDTNECFDASSLNRSAHDRAPKRVRLTAEQEAKMAASQEGAVRKEIEVLLHPLFRNATEIPEVVSNDLCFGSCFVPYVTAPNACRV